MRYFILCFVAVVLISLSQPTGAQFDQTGPDQAKPDQSIPDQAKPDQSIPDQAKPDQVMPDQTKGPKGGCSGRRARERCGIICRSHERRAHGRRGRRR